MHNQKVFETVKGAIMEVLPDVNPDLISIEKQLKDLGANSIDRMEVVTLSMESRGHKLPLMTFAQVGNLQDLVDVLAEKCGPDTLAAAER